MRRFGEVRRGFLAGALALGLASLAATAVADAPPPSASLSPSRSLSPSPADGVIQAIGVSPSRLGANADQLTFLPTGAPGPVVLTVDRPADKQALDLGARPGDRIWLTVDDPLNPRHVVQITRLARPVPALQRTIALVAAFAVIAAFASLATAGRPWRFLVGNDNRMSNSQTQMALWFGVVAMVYGATLILRAWFLGWEFMATRKELIEGVGQRYRASSGKDKPKILEEFVRLTGYHRKHVPGLYTLQEWAPASLTMASSCRCGCRRTMTPEVMQAHTGRADWRIEARADQCEIFPSIDDR